LKLGAFLAATALPGWLFLLLLWWKKAADKNCLACPLFYFRFVIVYSTWGYAYLDR